MNKSSQSFKEKIKHAFTIKLIQPVPHELTEQFDELQLKTSFRRYKIICILLAVYAIISGFLSYQSEIMEFKIPITSIIFQILFYGFIFLLINIISGIKKRSLKWCFYFLLTLFILCVSVYSNIENTSDWILSNFFLMAVATIIVPEYKPKMFIFLLLFFYISTVAVFIHGGESSFSIGSPIYFLSNYFIFFLATKILLYNSRVKTYVDTHKINSINEQLDNQNKFISSAFSTYVSHDVVNEIIADPSRMRLGGSKRYMTAVFTDVKGFSSIAESLGPNELVNILNKYLGSMSDIILDEKGTIDKYVGDAIVAFFGAPLELKDHALRACISAIKMKKAEAALNKIIIEEKLSPTPLITRIGINTGFMVAGNMGTKNKMNYTIMGSAVNLAARLEGANKYYGTSILTSDDTIRETGNQILYRNLDFVRVVGVNKPVRIYEIIDTVEEASEEAKKRVCIFHEALDFFEKRQWSRASFGFNEVLNLYKDDTPAKIYVKRCEEFITNPPAENWDVIYKMNTK